MATLNPFNRTCLAVAISQVIALPGAQAATLTVDSAEDNGAGCTLREAIDNSNNNNNGGGNGCLAGSGADDINIAIAGTITLTTGELAITDDVTITGPGSAQLSINGNDASRVFYINTATAYLNSLTVTGGSAASVGGGIYVSNASAVLTNVAVSNNRSGISGGGILLFTGASYTSGLTLIESTVTNNSASVGGGLYFKGAGDTVTITNNSEVSSNTADKGGGVYFDNGDTLILTNGTISGNSAQSGSGGGIYAKSSTRAIINESTVTGNSASLSGGGIYLKSSFSFSLTDSTVSNNHAGKGGGISIDNTYSVSLINSTVSANSASLSGGGGISLNDSPSYGADARLINSTVSGNSANTYGGGIAVRDATLTLQNVTVNDNSASSDPAALAAFTSSTVDLTNTILAGSGGPDCYLSSSTLNDLGGNLVEDDTNACSTFTIEGQSPMLGPLKNNGGKTFSHALLKGSPAINAGINTDCPTTDQRGRPRADGLCDIGSFEFIDDQFCYVINTPTGKVIVFCL